MEAPISKAQTKEEDYSMKRMIAWSIVWMTAAIVWVGVACFGNGLILSEIAWGGTAASSSDEWIELRNAGDEPVDLAGWCLTFGDVTILLGEAGDDTLEARTLQIEPGAFLLLERTDDTTVSDIVADVIYKGTLSNSGATVELLDPDGQIVDVVRPIGEAWPAGGASDAEVPYGTMERAPDGSWVSNDGRIRSGLDAEGAPLNGTPGQANSPKVLALHGPQLCITYPSTEGETLTGVVLITWTATDPDGDDAALPITLSLSENDEEWVPLVENLANTGSYAWDTNAQASGGMYRLRIGAVDLDGYVGTAVSVTFGIE